MVTTLFTRAAVRKALLRPLSSPTASILVAANKRHNVNVTAVSSAARFSTAATSQLTPAVQSQGRYFSSDSSYSAYEYPLATEAPEVTRTTAAEAATATTSSKVAPKVRPDQTDPFDDQLALSDEERQSIRSRQQQSLSTSLSSASLGPITDHVPSQIPSNVPASQLETPSTEITKLDNGVRVVSQETYGQVSTVGVVCQVGSRTETIPGITNLLEVLAFGSTEQYNQLQINQSLQDWGGIRFGSTGREQSLYAIDLLRPNAEKACHLLQQVMLFPTFPLMELEEAKQVLQFQASNMPPELILTEALQRAAYGPKQQLGRSHFCVDTTSLEQLEFITSEQVAEYWRESFCQNPQGLVIGGAGVRHEFLVEMAERYFGHLEQSNESKVVPSKYQGGQDFRTIPDAMDDFTRIAIALPVGGWHSEDLVTTCVLQTLLGGGSSFSAGGPGKGMYSRLYRQVLNRYAWAESAEAFTVFHEEEGMWGISGSTIAGKARDMAQVLAEHLANLGVTRVTDEELDRARNMLKCNVLTQLESRLVLFEDLGRQVLTYNKREGMKETCERIDAVTAEDVQALALEALKNPPTVAAVGKNVSNVPKQEEIAQWFSS